ncbi:hypothetical protein NZ698_00560 [Chryseobacterium sp. PBS4-4]|uniref:LysM domain-containing protein n=1 Tax=Chryseobacterium edaphi TaxID=2976532 RepID=A0ABT2W0A1_9FLAO|nr:hypothetical protein [Chryseobacterium edaphi]MCU7615672.1 hypothetical protein [Chryseobacterium edaphi]
MTITVLPNQSLLDIAIQHTGSVYNAFAIAVANGLPVTETLTTGQSLAIPILDTNMDVYSKYKKNKIEPATSLTNLELLPERGGIGKMKIGSTFKAD